MHFVSASDLLNQLSRLGASVSPELRVGCRSITAGDELQLTPAESASLRKSNNLVRRASGAARIVARELLSETGTHSFVELPRSTSGAPQWPRGYIGSLSHNHDFAVAAVAPSSVAASIGIDIEPAIALPVEILEIISTFEERKQIDGNLLSARLLFCIKEAVYKATHPIDGIFLEPHDVEICMTTSTATTKTGRTLRIFASSHPCLLALAVIPF